MSEISRLQNLLSLPSGGLAQSMIYFWLNACDHGRDFYEVINREFPDDTYSWHVSVNEHRAAADEAYNYLKQSNQVA